MSELDDLKARWRSISIEAPASGSDNPRDFRRLEKARSVRQRLIRRYRMMVWVMAFGILNGVALFRIVDFSWLTMIYFFLYMLLAGGLNLMQMFRLGNTDVVNLPVIDAIEFIKNFTRLRNRVEIILIVVCIPLVLLLLLSLEGEGQQEMLSGGITGGIIGAIIGIVIDRRFRADLKALLAFLGDTDDPQD